MLSRTPPPLVFALVAAVSLGTFAAGRAAPPAPLPVPPLAGIDWREAPDLRRLFTPRHVPAGSYQALTTAAPLADVLARLHADPAFTATPPAWRVERLSPLDAFGRYGDYDPWAVARLYGGRPAQVARGPRIEDGRVVESWTLIAPYPAPTLQTLVEGTLLVVLRLR